MRRIIGRFSLKSDDFPHRRVSKNASAKIIKVGGSDKITVSRTLSLMEGIAIRLKFAWRHSQANLNIFKEFSSPGEGDKRKL